ncbi:GntR family transcriptional regulator [Microbacterium phyllosphaerae]|uniref:GntR family transcriptional regulator n=1 Tax=Microbacterium phyllosphaerae TaxID=124798 RepID=UPI002168FA0E|nr:GntR family transcriptional regulator [Microbacterium phyllosphaerae]MCS3442180.1 DNA-binding GntR family transcriptional regulator [Microbacterium phyllosphaerae]
MPVPIQSTKVARRLLRDEAADAIRDAILTGHLAPGESLDDASLQAWMGVSRTPIRDALLKLQIEGLVVVNPQSGTHVATATLEEVEESLQAIGGVIGAVIRVTAGGLDAQTRESVVELVQGAILSARAHDAEAHMHATLHVYDALLNACPNKVLVNIARSSVIPLTFRYRAVFPSRTPNWDLLIAGWGKLKYALSSGNNVLAELAFEELHRLPLPDQQWEPAVWDGAAS